MKSLLFGVFVIGGWTVAIGALGLMFWMWMTLVPGLPLWVAIGAFPLLGFVVAVLHFRAILRSA